MKLKENNARGDGGWTLEGDFGKKNERVQIC